MKQSQSNPFALAKTVRNILVTILLLGVLTDCSKSDDPTPILIQIGETSVVSVQAKTCTSGPGYRFVLKTKFDSEPTITVKKLVIVVVKPDGTTQTAEYTDNEFQNNGSDVDWAGCFGFGTSTKLELKISMVGEQGEISNVSNYTLNKP